MYSIAAQDKDGGCGPMQKPGSGRRGRGQRPGRPGREVQQEPGAISHRCAGLRFPDGSI